MLTFTAHDRRHADYYAAVLWLADHPLHRRPQHEIDLQELFLTTFGADVVDLFDPNTRIVYDQADWRVLGTMFCQRVAICYAAMSATSTWYVTTLDAAGESLAATSWPLVSARGLDQAPPAVMRGQVFAWILSTIGVPDDRDDDLLYAMTVAERAIAQQRILDHGGFAGWCRITFGPQFERNAAWSVTYETIADARCPFNAGAVITTHAGEQFLLRSHKDPDNDGIAWTVTGRNGHGLRSRFEHGAPFYDTVNPHDRLLQLLQALNTVRATPHAFPAINPR